jgi:tryptophanyl-tRNA synthetase
MRPTGLLHLGHYHGAIKNWVKLQDSYDCFYFAADYHALTTHYEDPSIIARSVWDMMIDWMACGVDPQKSTLFIQSRLPQHAELSLLLGMFTPLGWLERMPTYKDQKEKLTNRDLETYGFLGYPVMQAADIMAYRANYVPVGEDQVVHIELTREIARRFNHFFGREPGHAEKLDAALKKLGGKGKRFSELAATYTQSGDVAALDEGKAILSASQNLGAQDRERLAGHLEGKGRSILTEPQPMLSPVPKMPGLDGQKMSKSYGNAIELRDGADVVAAKVKKMQTDPARVRRTDKGNPANCPVWQLHQVYSDDARKAWVQQGCTTAGIGCIECKTPVIDAINAELDPIRRKASELASDMGEVKRMVFASCERAKAVAEETMKDVRASMGIALD